MKKSLLLATLVVVACDRTPTGTAPPEAKSLIVITPQSVLVVNGSVQLAARVFDQDAKAIPGVAVTWESLQPSVATVTTSGLATGVSVGMVTVRATTAGGISGQATLTVDPDPCTTPLDLQVGEVRQLSGPAAVACITLAPTTASTDFLFVTANADQGMDQLAFYSVNLAQQAGAVASAGSASLDASDPQAILQSPGSDYPRIMDGRIRAQERAAFPRLRGIRTEVAPSYGANADLLVAPPSAGDTLMYRVPDIHAADLCATYTTVRGVVKYVSQHGVFVQDANAPTGGFAAQDYTDIATEWESLIFPTDTMYFGAPTDRNQDGHITILYTPVVNKATPQGKPGGYIAGFFWGGDLVKKTEYQQINQSCPQTNEQEIFYMLVPDPSGTVNSNVFTVETVKQNTRGTVAHEFQHMINQGLRLLNPAVDSSETIWLNEGLSHFAEEIVGRAFRGFGDFQNLSFHDVNPNPSSQNDYLAFFRENLLRLRPWMARPDTSSPISVKARDQLAPRGAAWMLLRYLTDHVSNGNAKAFLRHIVAGPDIGVRNLVQWSNGAQFDDMLRGFLVSMYTDETGVPGLSAQYAVPSWNIRDVMQSVNSGIFPLLVTSLPSAISTQSLSGSGNYFRLTRQSASPQATFRMTAAGGAPVTFAGARVYVVRLN